RSAWPVKSRSSPSRTIGWSSARTRLAGMGEPGAVEREENLAAGPPLAGVHGERAAEGVDPRPEADRSALGADARVAPAATEREPPAVVDHHDAERPVADLELDLRAPRVAVAGRVDERLLDDELRPPRQLAREAGHLGGGGDGDREPPVAGDAVAQLLEPCGEADVRGFERAGGGLEVPEEDPEVPLLGREEPLDLAEPLGGGRRVTTDKPQRRLELETRRGQGLEQPV